LKCRGGLAGFGQFAERLYWTWSLLFESACDPVKRPKERQQTRLGASLAADAVRGVDASHLVRIAVLDRRQKESREKVLV
jgi:hypothetical protein